ncbi:MAG: molecular chaperone GrpE [Patescibacteria group bacterium]|nr:molecular chaperone GrpE [Patescibacteria group bacterium]
MDGTEEEFVPEDEAVDGPSALKKLREKLKKAVEEKQEYLDGWQRARADFANYKREEATLYVDREDRIKAEFVEELLPALDSFELSLRHTPDNKDLAMIYRQLLSALKNLGVEQFGKAGETFNPHTYEALREVATEEVGKEHTIESVERSGYSIGDRVIRPAQVSVYTS